MDKETMVGKDAASSSPALGGRAPMGHSGEAAQQLAVPVAGATLLAKVESLIAKVDGIAKSDALKAKGVVEKYWPIAVGVLIAATRLL